MMSEFRKKAMPEYKEKILRKDRPFMVKISCVGAVKKR